MTNIIVFSMDVIVFQKLIMTQLTLIPFLDKINQNLPKKFENVIADAGYESEENYMFLEMAKQNSFIKSQSYDSMKKKNFKNQISRRENMTYDEESDNYICFNKKKLLPIGTITRKSKSGYKSEVTIYECENCCDCTYKDKCTKAKGNKKLQVSKQFVTERNKSLFNKTSAVDFFILSKYRKTKI